jgi:hypothetical protein
MRLRLMRLLTLLRETDSDSDFEISDNLDLKIYIYKKMIIIIQSFSMGPLATVLVPGLPFVFWVGRHQRQRLLIVNE